MQPSQSIPISPTPEVPEWVLIEINGELLPPIVMPSQDESETILELGRLYLTNEKHPMLLLGSHQLKGKSVDLKEHFTVLEKNYDSELNDLLSYLPVGIVKKKILFSDYPKIIMK
ncbi:unnamed protein product [Cylindrotheca closterium]|uniref:Uncharacterized protein n=1 Tax=Cylindrotheca closterium TaxID=2856 RepID=A0AAD2GE84_9STRA|nr:unnamed protein product [Cylindrotheca closterium]